MITEDYFFLIFLGTIALTRLLLIKKIAAPTIKGFRLRHYMYGIVLVASAFIIKNPIFYAVGVGLLVDELPVALMKGPGHKDEYWKGCEYYHSSWSFAGVLILALLVFIFRTEISGLI